MAIPALIQTTGYGALSAHEYMHYRVTTTGELGDGFWSPGETGIWFFKFRSEESRNIRIWLCAWMVWSTGSVEYLLSSCQIASSKIDTEEV
jgi:hypothetical protein